VEGASEAGIHHQSEIEGRAIAIGIEGQASEIRNRGPDDHDHEEEQENQNGDRNVGLKTGQLDFEIFDLNSEVFSRLVRILDKVKLGAKADAVMHDEVMELMGIAHEEEQGDDRKVEPESDDDERQH
jgi:hypothetical protein